MSYKGIDYGHGQTNIDTETGIRYGVISQYVVGQAWYDDTESDYGHATCPDCGNEIDEDTLHCDTCDNTYDFDDCYSIEPYAWFVNDGEYTASQSSDDSDIFITKSPYYTRAQFCSPCAPGACHLENPIDDGEKCYCFGHDWFEGEKAPYPVYRVDDDSLVEPTN